MRLGSGREQQNQMNSNSNTGIIMGIFSLITWKQTKNGKNDIKLNWGSWEVTIYFIEKQREIRN